MTRMKKILLPFLLIVSLSSSAQQMLTLEEAIATALNNNYDIQLSRNDSMVAALDYSYRNAIFLPRLNGTVGNTWTRNKQNQEFSNATKREGKVKTNNLSASLNLNWTLFDGLKMFATRDKAEELIRLGELGIKNQVINTVAAVVNTYYNIVRQKQQLRAIEEQMSISQTRVNLAERKLDIGVGTKPDVLQSKVDLNAQKASQLEQQTLIAQLKEQLNQVMNVKQTAGYEVADSIPLNTTMALGDVQAGIENSNPLLQISKKSIDIAGFTLKERRAERFPVVSFNSAYNFSRTNNDVALNPALPIFNQNKGLNYGVSATIPILNNFNTRRLIKQAQLDIQYQQLVYNNQRSQLDLSVINAFKEYEQQKKALALEEENILLAKENVTIALEVYRLGASTIIQLREAQKSLEDAYNRLIAARYNTKLAETELLRLKGDLVK
ncbi:MAG TPA: TolC family protein [Chitinophagaceae bacterium]